MALDLTTFEPALKQLYPESRIENMVYKDNPFLAMVPKNENFVGDDAKIAIKFGLPQGRSATFVTAQANKTNTELKAFRIRRKKDYSLATIDNETIEASRSDAGALIEAASLEMDSAFESIIRALAIDLYGTGSGSRGQIDASTTLASTVLVLSSEGDVTNFEVGMRIVLSATDGGGTVKPGSLEVVGVDRDSGEITVDQNIDTGVPTAALSDFIFQEGDYDLKVSGIRAWIPDTAPTAGDSFFGVDRSSDVTRLAGLRFDGSALPIEEALNQAANRVAREGGRPDYCYMSFAKYAELVDALGAKVNYVNEQVKAGEGYIAFQSIRIHGPKGAITVVPDQNCPDDRAFMLQMDSWKMYSLGKAPRLLDMDGLKMLRESNADAVEIRIGYYAQLSCRAPGFNVNIKLD